MVGNINNLLIIILVFSLGSCQSSKKEVKNKNVYIRMLNDIKYNNDIVNYYVVNKTNEDIKILLNPDFFKRQKDSLFINTWFNPKMEIYDGRKTLEPNLLSVHYNKQVVDSLMKIENKYTEIFGNKILSESDLSILKKYILVIKQNDSIKFTTKIHFEVEPRFYDFSESEGYILTKGRPYSLKLFLNEDINPNARKFFEKENIYLQEIHSDKVNLIFVKTNYSR
jgi:hypothetical protein